MNNQITFGRYEGRTFEWLFFKRPNYVRWLYENGIHRQNHFGEEQCDVFEEFYRRAEHLGGTCSCCKERPVTRMGLATSFKFGGLRGVGFYCDECEMQCGSRVSYYQPSFFVDTYGLETWEQKMVQSRIKRHYIGSGNLTQKRMEVFFSNDANFAASRAGFPSERRANCSLGSH